MVSLGDAQIVFGMAFLITGYTQVPYISGYHWVMITRIAWFSSATHLAVLSCSPRYLYRHPWKRNIRFFFITILALLLIVATITTGWEREAFESPAHCMFNINWTVFEYDDFEPLFGTYFLLISIAVRAFKSYQSLSKGGLTGRRNLAGNILRVFRFLLKSRPKNDTLCCFYLIVVLQPFMAISVVFDIYLQLFSSMLVEVGVLPCLPSPKLA